MPRVSLFTRARRSKSAAVSALLLSALLAPALPAGRQGGRSPKPLLIAHRGASAYAPEHTLAAYRMAIEQGADFVEQDVQVTKDGLLICAHDAELSRTTNVEEVFPGRAAVRDVEGSGEARRGWYAVDFTLAEIKRLDAGSWFNSANPFAARESYKAESVPTLEEAVKAIGKRAGLYIEMKHFEFYRSAGHDMAASLAATLKANGYDRAGLRHRVFIQSFSKTSLLRMREVAPMYQRVQLLPMEDAGRKDDSSKASAALAAEVASYAQGAGPSKSMIQGPEDVAIFHKAGLIVHPYTFRGTTTAAARRPLDEPQPGGATLRQAVVSEIRRFLEWGVDGGFTDYPDLWKEAALKTKIRTDK